MTVDAPLDLTPPRRKSRWPAFVLIALCGLAVGAVAYGRATVAEIADGLPRTPDAATMPVSTEVVDRNGELLRPFTTADGIWRLPIETKDVDRRFIDMREGNAKV